MSNENLPFEPGLYEPGFSDTENIRKWMELNRQEEEFIQSFSQEELVERYRYFCANLKIYQQSDPHRTIDRQLLIDRFGLTENELSELEKNAST
jgi:hypothetical protein